MQGHFIVAHDYELSGSGHLFLLGEDLHLDISIVGPAMAGGWAWKIEAIGRRDISQPGKVYHWLASEDHPVIAAVILDIEANDKKLDAEIQYLAREREAA
jgi:hypothetical protein